MKTKIVGRQRNETLNENNVLTERVSGVQMNILDEHDNAIGSISVNETHGSFHINAPIADVQKMAEAIGKVLVGEKK